MIDWVTAIVPCSNIDISNLHNGWFCRIRPDGVTEWSKEIGKDVPGSFDSNLRVSAYPMTSGQHIRIDGNPAKWIQGHNLFGTNDLVGLMCETLIRIAYFLEFIPIDKDWKSWKEGLYKINRVDCTEMWEFPSKADVLAWLNTAQYQSKSRHGRSIMTGGTLYFGKHSRRYSIKFYCKEEEIKVKGHRLPDNIHFRNELLEFSKNKLRCELVLRAPKLKELELDVAAGWTTDLPMQLLRDHLKFLDISDQFKLTSTMIEGLPSRLQLAYQCWENGSDLRAALPKNTFYRYRRDLLSHGIDISVSKSNGTGSPVPLKQVLGKKFVELPSWAKGSKALFTPSRNLK